MNTTQTTGPLAHTYKVDVVATDGSWHRIAVQSHGYQGVKVAARKIAKAQGVKVKYVNGMFIA